MCAACHTLKELLELTPDYLVGKASSFIAAGEADSTR